MFKIASEAKVVAFICQLQQVLEANLLGYFLEKMCTISVGMKKNADKLEAEIEKEKAERLSAFKLLEDEIIKAKAKQHEILAKSAIIINSKKKKIRQLKANPERVSLIADKPIMEQPQSSQLGSFTDSLGDVSQKTSTLADLFK